MQSQQQQRRRKKRPNYGTRTVEVKRGYNLDFGFTISGQQPCRLSCIVQNSPAEQAGLRPGDYLISVNGLNVSKLAHETVVQLIGNSFGSIRMQIAENYFSDSSDEENAAAAALLHAGNGSPLRATMAGVRQRPRFLHHRAKMHRLRNSPQKKRNQTSPNTRLTANIPTSQAELSQKPGLRPLIEDLPLQSATNSRIVPTLSTKIVPATPAVSADVANVSAMVRVVPSSALEYRVVVGYMGTIEMPKQISHSSKLQTVRSCIRKLRQEKRQPTTVLMTILPDCLKLESSNGNILATYASSRLNYVSSSSESENRFFGLVTSAVHTSQADDDDDDEENNEEENSNANGAANMDANIRPTNIISISNSCHVFIIDTKLCDHHGHLQRANEFRIQCTRDPISSLCLEFPRHAEYVVNLIRSMYTMRILPPATRQTINAADEPVAAGVVGAAAHSPQPSNHSEISTTTSNSDSGIGFHNDCANISDRILVVDFPGNRAPLLLQAPPIPAASNSRPLGIFSNFDPVLDNRLTVRAMPDPKTAAALPPPRPPALGIHNLCANNGRPDLLANFDLIKSPGACSLAATRSCDDVLGLVDSRSGDDYDKYGIYLNASHASMDDLSTGQNLANSFFMPPAVVPPNKRAAASDTYALLEDYRTGTRSSRRSLQNSIDLPNKLSPQVFATPKSLNTTPTKSKSTSRYSFGWSCHSSTDILAPPSQSTVTPTVTASTTATNITSSSALFDFDVDTWSSLQNLHAMVQHEYHYQKSRALEATNSEPDLGNNALPSNASPFRRAWGQSSFRTSRTEKQSPLGVGVSGCSSSASPLVRRAASMTASDNDVYIKSMNGYVEELKQAQLKKLGSNKFITATTAATAAASYNGTASQGVSFKTPFSSTSATKQNKAEAFTNIDSTATSTVGAAAATASVAEWGSSFERLIENAAGLNTFAEFLKKEFSAENIYFWTACERFRQTEDQAERAKQARDIFNKHLANGSLEPVNVDSQARNLSEEKLQSAEPNIFAPAQKQIFNLMKFDSYQRFIRSDLYKSCQEAEEKDQPLPFPAERLDELLRLSVHQNGASAGAASKLKKSASNAEDRRRKSLLPWHRKTRSKSRDRCEATELTKSSNSSIQNPIATKNNGAPSKLPTLTTSSSLKIPSTHNSLSDIHSSRSSLSSFDAVTANVGQVHAAAAAEIACSLCRVILSDGATTIVQTRADETVGQLVERLLEKRGLQYKYYDVVATCGSSKSMDLQSNALATLAGKEVLIEQRVAFKIDLPDPKVISVKSKPKKALHEVIRPILHKYNYEMDAVQVFVRDTQSLLDLSLPVTVVDGQRLQIVLLRQQPNVESNNLADYQNSNCTVKFVRPSPLFKSSSTATMVPTPFNKTATNYAASRNALPQSTLDEITNKVFNELLQGKVEANDKAQQQTPQQSQQPTKISDLCSIKSDDCASETSSVFERIRRRDSSNIPAPRLRNKKKSISSQHSTEETTQNGQNGTTTTTTTTIIELKKPIIAKLKAGVKLQVTERVKENQDDLLEGLKRAQLARLEDQRGTEINFELPEFLKHKENISAAASKLRKVRASLSPINTKSTNEKNSATTTTSTTTLTSPTTSTKSLPSTLLTPPIKIMPQPAPRLSITNRQKANNSISPMKIDEEEVLDGTTAATATTTTTPMNGNESFEQVNIDNGKGPPPLPPKPKVLPMKPSNWGAAASNFGSNTSISKIPIDINRKLSTSSVDAATAAAAAGLASTGSTQSLQQQHCAYLEEPTSSFV